MRAVESNRRDPMSPRCSVPHHQRLSESVRVRCQAAADSNVWRQCFAHAPYQLAAIHVETVGEYQHVNQVGLTQLTCQTLTRVKTFVRTADFGTHAANPGAIEL